MSNSPTVCNRIFGVLLAGYLSGVEAYGKKSSDRGAHGDVRLPHFRLNSAELLI